MILSCHSTTSRCTSTSSSSTTTHNNNNNNKKKISSSSFRILSFFYYNALLLSLVFICIHLLPDQPKLFSLLFANAAFVSPQQPTVTPTIRPKNRFRVVHTELFSVPHKKNETFIPATETNNKDVVNKSHPPLLNNNNSPSPNSSLKGKNKDKTKRGPSQQQLLVRNSGVKDGDDDDDQIRRDSLPFLIQMPASPYQTKLEKAQHIQKLKKKLSENKHTKTSTFLNSKLYLQNNTSNNSAMTMMPLGEFRLDKSTTTGDILQLQDDDDNAEDGTTTTTTRLYKVIQHRCQYQYRGGKFRMVRKILHVKEVSRIQQEEYIQRQYDNSSSE